MAGAYGAIGNTFDSLPDVLLHNILMLCSPIDQIRAAATCHTLWKIYYELNKQLVFHSITFDGSGDENTLVCPAQIGKLKVILWGKSNTESGAANVYTDVQLFVERTRSDRALHLCNVYELGIQRENISIETAQQCIQQLLQLLPNLTSIWLDKSDGMRCLDSDYQQSIPGIRRLGLPCNWTGVSRLFLVPFLLPSVNTICLKGLEPVNDKWWEPLLKLPQLRYLSLISFHKQQDLSVLHRITTLRHLKLETNDIIDMRRISDLQQLESLCLCGVQVTYPDALAQLNVTSLTLQFVTSPEPRMQLLHAQQHPPAGPRWPNLASLYFAGFMSEQLLQAMLLPRDGINVKISFDSFDNFDCECCGHSRQTYNRNYIHDADIFYQADIKPFLGPSYLAAARPIAIEIRSGDIWVQRFVVDIARQLLLLDPDVCQWHKRLLKHPWLIYIMFYLCVLGPRRITARQPTRKSGITTSQPTTYIYQFVPYIYTADIEYPGKQVIPACIRGVLLQLLVLLVVCYFRMWLVIIVVFPCVHVQFIKWLKPFGKRRFPWYYEHERHNHP